MVKAGKVDTTSNKVGGYEEANGRRGSREARRVLRRMCVGVVDVSVPMWSAKEGSKRASSRDNRSADSLDFVKIREIGM